MFKDEKVDVKVVYFELIKMLLDQDRRQRPEGFQQTKDVEKIQGFQELTNRLQFNLNEKYLSQLEKVNDRLNKLEQLLQGDDNTNVFAKLDQLEDKMAQLNLEQKEKAEELNNNVSDNNTRLSALEGQNYDQQMDLNEIKDELKAKEDSESTEKMMQDFMAKLQSDNLDTLSKRIDTNENHIKLLEEKDDQLDGDMERVNENIINIDGRLDALEKAHEEQMTKAQKIEEDESTLTNFFKEFKQDFDQFKEDQDVQGEKVHVKMDSLTQESRELQDDNDKIKEKIRQLEGVNNENAEVINKFTVTHITFESKVDELEKDSDTIKEKINDIEDKTNDVEERMDKAESNIRDAHDRLDDLKDLKKALEQTHDDLDKSKSHSSDKLKNLEDQLTNLENDLNGNKQKIEDANGVIKRHTEQILELEPEINDVKYDMSQMANFKKDLQEDLDNVKEASEAKDETHQNQIDLLKNQLNDLQVKDEDFNDRINNNLEKIVNLEENSVMQEQKARYVEALNERVQAMDEAKQQSEAKTKEEVEEKLKTNQELLDSLKKDIENNL